MTRRLRHLAFGMMLLIIGLKTALAQLPDPAEADEKILKAANRKTDPASLLEFFRQRTLPDKEREEYRGYVKQLGSEIFRQREQAMSKLVAKGPVVVELLREALKEPDLEVVRRAERCIQRIQDTDVGADVPGAAA